MKYTPGPWRHSFGIKGRRAEVSTKDNRFRIALVFCRSLEQCEADARLIASAPDLLEVCIQILALWRSKSRYNQFIHNLLKRTVAKAKVD